MLDLKDPRVAQLKKIAIVGGVDLTNELAASLSQHLNGAEDPSLLPAGVDEVPEVAPPQQAMRFPQRYSIDEEESRTMLQIMAQQVTRQDEMAIQMMKMADAATQANAALVDALQRLAMKDEKKDRQWHRPKDSAFDKKLDTFTADDPGTYKAWASQLSAWLASMVCPEMITEVELMLKEVKACKTYQQFKDRYATAMTNTKVTVDEWTEASTLLHATLIKNLE